MKKAIGFCLLGMPAVVFCAYAAEVKVDFGKTVGSVKRVNGVGQPPMIGALADWSMMHYLKEAGIPYSRLHDVGGWLGGGLYVGEGFAKLLKIGPEPFLSLLRLSQL